MQVSILKYGSYVNFLTNFLLRFIPFEHLEVCKMESDCSTSSKCNGSSAECPAPSPRPDKTRCNNDTQLCINGECKGSRCLEWNLQVIEKIYN